MNLATLSSGAASAAPAGAPVTRAALRSRDWAHRADELGERLPAGFTLGVTSTAFQIEGAARDGGRGDSAWDRFTQQPGRILDASNASVAADHVARYLDDAKLLRDLGIDTYRFSLGWSRLQPEGRGALNRHGLAFYDRLLDALLGGGMTTMVALSDWDLPAALRGGWMNRDTAGRFADYAHEVGATFGDRIDAWVTLTDPATVTVDGYGVGTHAPGAKLLFEALPTAHHQLLAHGLAVQGLRAADVRGQIGLFNAHTPVQASTDREQDRSYAALFDLLNNRLFADPVLLGHYPDPLEPFADELRTILEADPADLRIINQPLDFYGLSYTEPSRVASGPLRRTDDDGEPLRVTSWPFHLEAFREHPVTGAGAVIAPEYLAAALGELQARYADALPSVYLSVAASGTSRATGTLDTLERGAVHDALRIDYLAEHLGAAVAAAQLGGVAEGVTLRGYFVGSLLDGFEWAAGYTQRYGLVYVDFADERRTRTPKDSYRWLQELLANR